jgi:uncharacterized membrane protein YeaQ/YmgE (transglycosylase-associated protein family)
MSDENQTELFCAYHPDRPTMLRCNRCNKPICASCAILTPTGYRCKECVRSQQKIFDTAVWSDYLLGIVIAGILGFIGSYVVTYIGFFTLLLAPAMGTLIAEVVRRAVRRRRSRQLFLFSTVAAVVGSLPILLLVVFGSGLFSILWQGAYSFLMASTLYYRLSGIQIGRN